MFDYMARALRWARQYLAPRPSGRHRAGLAVPEGPVPPACPASPPPTAPDADTFIDTGAFTAIRPYVLAHLDWQARERAARWARPECPLQRVMSGE